MAIQSDNMDYTNQEPLRPCRATIIESIHGDKEKHAGNEESSSVSSSTSLFHERKALTYFARPDCFMSRIGTVFTDWDSIAWELFYLDEKLFVDVQSKSTRKPCFEFNITNISNTPNKISSIFRISHDIEQKSYHITNLAVNEWCIDDEFMRILGGQQIIADTIRKSPRKQVFFVYGIARAGKVHAAESYSSNRGWRFAILRRNLSLHYNTSTSKDLSSSSTMFDTTVGIAVLKLTIKNGGLKAEKLTTGAHF